VQLIDWLKYFLEYQKESTDSVEFLDSLKTECNFEQVFKQITLARIIEPSSKLDIIEVLDDLVLEALSNTSMYRSLHKSIKLTYRETIFVSIYRVCKDRESEDIVI
jgi:hypothetical protein